MSEPILEVSELSVAFPAGRVLDRVSFGLHADQTLAIVGESGSGKSMTALSVMRLLPRAARIESGRIGLREGEETTDILALDAGRLRGIRGLRIAMIFQEPMTSLNPVLTVGDQVMEAIRLHRGLRGRDARGAAIEALTSTGIREAGERLSAYPHELSGGMRQRVMIAMALVGKPRVLLADEPTTALDAMIQSQILDLISEARRERGLGVVLITHDVGLVRQRSEAVCVMYRGRVVEFGPTPAVLGEPLHPYTRALLACSPGAARRGHRLPTVADFFGSTASPEHGIGGRVPWWPEHPAPHHSARCLLEPVSEERWVGVWSEPGEESPARAVPRALPMVRAGARDGVSV